MAELGRVLLELDSVSIDFATLEGSVRVVHGVSLTLREGEILGIAGAASAGKTTLLQAVVGALPKTAFVSAGTIRFEGQDLSTLHEEQLRRLHGAQLGYIPSGGMAHLNPVRKVGRQIADVLRSHRKIGRAEAAAEAVRLLERVRIDSPGQRTRAYPHELSGGMAQRAAIAMGIACDPRVVLSDEPTAGLDVTIQAAILDLLVSLIREEGSAAVIATRELGIVSNYCTSILVLRDGAVVERGPVAAFFEAPTTEYARSLVQLAFEEEQSLDPKFA